MLETPLKYHLKDNQQETNQIHWLLRSSNNYPRRILRDYTRDILGLTI
ncbi:hypothetical protein GMOD_00010383 [Pyrenophora seminiperda CCB06]|uniref:Uncharacterized protein n=1 Tax=Pyrenophora seminiperda CCB06 TaxID=1302712 RepID=A0A3M7M5E3_9PLEO|nr:hypothetical protein GMOD_00010383 [Pyrenophora seminiperda CCB06]